MAVLRRITQHAPGLFFAGVLLYLVFSDGGSAASPTAVGAIALAAALLGVVMLARRPFDGFTRAGAAVLVALALYTGWVVLSRWWSGTTFGSDLDAQRLVLYAGVFTFGLLTGRDPETRQWTIRWVAVALAAFVWAALAGRIWPELVPQTAALDNESRLAWPITYWNGLGTLAGLSVIMAIHLGSHGSSRLVDRVLGSALLPGAAAALLLTLSRGGLVATIAAGVVYVAATRPRGLPVTALIGIPTAGWTVLSVLGADALTSVAWRTASAQAHHLLVALVISTGAAAVLRLLALPLDRRIAGLRIPRLPRPVRLAVPVAVVGLLALGFFASGGPDRVQAQIKTFKEQPHDLDGRGADRLTSLQGNGRIKMWRVALQAHETAPLIGTGANTFRWEWNQRRGRAPDRSEAHSLYLESLAELGWIGLGVLVSFLLLLLIGIVRARRRDHDAAASLALGLLVLLLVQASVDWVWEISAISFVVLAVAGTALARPRVSAPTRDEPATAEPAAAQKSEADVIGTEAPTVATTGAKRAVGRGSTPELGRIGAALALLLIVSLPVRVALSEAKVSAASEQLAAGDCPGAIASAEAARRFLARPDATLPQAYCLVGMGRATDAERALREGWATDRLNWVYPFAISIIRANSGSDPRPVLQEARALDPTGTQTTAALERFVGTRPRQWQFEATKVTFPIRQN